VSQARGESNADLIPSVPPYPESGLSDLRLEKAPRVPGLRLSDELRHASAHRRTAPITKQQFYILRD